MCFRLWRQLFLAVFGVMDSNAFFSSGWLNTTSETYINNFTIPQIDGLVRERRSSIAYALELHLSCINPSKCHYDISFTMLMHPTKEVVSTTNYNHFSQSLQSVDANLEVRSDQYCLWSLSSYLKSASKPHHLVTKHGTKWPYWGQRLQENCWGIKISNKTTTQLRIKRNIHLIQKI